MARKEFETLTPQMFYILLALYETCCGIDIMNSVKVMSKDTVQIGAGTLYSLLPRFEAEKFICFVKEEDKKRYYRITETGKRRLQKEKEDMIKRIQLLEEKEDTHHENSL